jgi:hypothetical protein
MRARLVAAFNGWSSLLRKVSGAVAVLALCVLSAEVAGTLFCYWETGSLVYLGHRIPPTSSPPAPAGVTKRPHPYFGWVRPYSIRFPSATGEVFTNNFGFMQREPVTIPYQPQPGDLIVAVLGGSVATRTVLGQEGGTPLRVALQTQPTLEGRKVVLISMAQGAQKQPQQLIELAVLVAMGQHIDLAVNIDGYNEFALGMHNLAAGLHPILPPAGIMRGLANELSGLEGSPEHYRLAYEMLQARTQFQQQTERSAAARTGLTYAVAHAGALLARSTHARSAMAYEIFMHTGSAARADTRLSLDMPAPKPEDPIQDLFDLWLRSSRAMRALAAAGATRYLHVVQPNQYFSRHRFSEHERRIAVSTSLPTGLDRGYALIEQRMPELAKLDIVSAIDLFDAVDGEVYADDCCHFNGRGETLFAEYVAKEIAGRLARPAP